MRFLERLKLKNLKWKVELIGAYLSEKESLLDFGAGDLSLASGLKQKFPNLRITGVDVVDQGSRFKGINYVKYDGVKIPFRNDSFDTVLSFYVFHHTDDPSKYLKECLRVAKKRVLFVESVARHPVEFPAMRFMDWLYNIWKPEVVPLTYKFYTLSQWKIILSQDLVRKYSIHKVSDSPLALLPIGRTIIFEVIKKSKK